MFFRKLMSLIRRRIKTVCEREVDNFTNSVGSIREPFLRLVYVLNFIPSSHMMDIKAMTIAFLVSS